MFALIHGCFAQIVFATLVSLALFTSRRWTTDPMEGASPAVKRWSLVTMLLVYGQLVLGGLVRHTDDLLGPRGHLLGAFVVTGAILWLLKLMRESESAERFRVQRVLLMAFLALQLLLGVESWLAKFHVDYAANMTALAPLPMHAEWIRTLHYLVGTLIFSTTVTVALVAHRRPVAIAIPERSRELEGVV
jgi:heme A synthase